MSKLRRIALFDLDHTLLPIDSDQSWGEFTLSLGWVDQHDFKSQNDAFYADYQAGCLDIHAYVRFGTEAIRRKGQTLSNQAHTQFMAQVIEPSLQTRALSLVHQHRQQGDWLVLITATNEFVTSPIARRLGMDVLIATELERDAQGWYTGEILGTPCLKEGKVSRFEDWMHDNELGWSNIHTTFYSDSMNDLPLLAKVNQPVATNPDGRLKAEALLRGWPILQLFETR